MRRLVLLALGREEQDEMMRQGRKAGLCHLLSLRKDLDSEHLQMDRSVALHFTLLPGYHLHFVSTNCTQEQLLLLPPYHQLQSLATTSMLPAFNNVSTLAPDNVCLLCLPAHAGSFLRSPRATLCVQTHSTSHSSACGHGACFRLQCLSICVVNICVQ